MPRPLEPIPGDLASQAFSCAQARALGLMPTALRHPRFERPYHGVRRLQGQTGDPGPVRSAALALRPRLRTGEAFSHSTALALLGCPIRIDPRPHVTAPRPLNPTRARSVHGHSANVPFVPWVDPTGMPLVPPGLAFLQASEILPFRELVVAADHLALPRRERPGAAPILAIEELREIVARASGRGIRRARAALRFARIGAESRMETLLRLLMARYGLDVLELQVDLRDAHGRWIGRFDMVDVLRRLIVEYDGEQHRTSDAQYERDQVRLERAREAGFRVLRFRRRQLLDEPLTTVHRIAAALDRVPEEVRGELAHYFAE